MYFLITGFFVVLANLSLIFLKNVFLAVFLILLAGAVFLRRHKNGK